MIGSDMFFNRLLEGVFSFETEESRVLVEIAQHFLYFLPLPQGQGELRFIFPMILNEKVNR